MADTRMLIVNVKGGAEFASITEAVKAAVDGDVIQVHLGQYDEIVLLDRAVRIVAEPNIEVDDIVVLGGAVITASGSIEGLTFLQMVDVRQGKPTLSRCTISLGSDGVRVCTGADATIVDCKLHGAQSGGDGVYVQEGGKARIEKCELFNNRVNAVHCNGGEVIVSQCKIHDCAFGVYFRKGGKGLVENNAIDSISRFGIYIVQSSDPVISRNTIMNCGISGIMISNGALASIRDNTVHGSVRILQGCSPVLGVNTINGHFDNENAVGGSTIMSATSPLLSSGSAAASASVDRKASVMARS
jgi:parallel beta-helix repeat protein